MDESQRARHEAALEALRAGRYWEAAPALEKLAAEVDDAEVWCDAGNAAQDYRWMQDARKAYERARELGSPRGDWELGSMLIDDEPELARPLLERSAAYIGPDREPRSWAFESQRYLAPDAAARVEVSRRYVAAFENDDRKLADALSWLGFDLADIEREESRAAHRRSLELYERVLGPSHKITIAQLGLLATQMREWGEDGGPLLRAHLEKVDGHGAALTWNKLSDYLWPIDLEAGLAAFEKSLVIEEQALGFCHPATGELRDWIRSSYERLERKEDELRVQRESAERAEKQLGPAHADTFDLYVWLARWSGDERLKILRALAKRQERALGNHPAVVRTLDEIYEASYLEDRLELVDKILAMRETIHGSDSLELFRTLDWKVGEVIKRRASNFEKEVLALWQRLFDLWKKAPFHENDEVPSAVSIGAGWLEERAKLERWKQIVSICEDSFGKKHPATAKARVQLGELLGKSDPEAAQRELEAGADSMEGLDAVRSLAQFHSNQGNHAEAIRLREQVVAAEQEERRGFSLIDLAIELDLDGQIDRAIHTIGDAIAVSDAHHAAQFHIRAAEMLERAGRLADAMPFARAAIALVPEIQANSVRPSVACDAAELARKNSDFEEAIGWYELALREGHHLPYHLQQSLIECCFELDRYDALFGWLSELLKEKGRDFAPLLRRALAKRKKGALDEAVELYDDLYKQAVAEERSGPTYDTPFVAALRHGRDALRKERKRKPTTKKGRR